MEGTASDETGNKCGDNGGKWIVLDNDQELKAWSSVKNKQNRAPQSIVADLMESDLETIDEHTPETEIDQQSTSKEQDVGPSSNFYNIYLFLIASLLLNIYLLRTVFAQKEILMELEITRNEENIQLQNEFTKIREMIEKLAPLENDNLFEINFGLKGKDEAIRRISKELDDTKDGLSKDLTKVKEMTEKLEYLEQRNKNLFQIKFPISNVFLSTIKYLGDFISRLVLFKY